MVNNDPYSDASCSDIASTTTSTSHFHIVQFSQADFDHLLRLHLL